MTNTKLCGPTKVALVKDFCGRLALSCGLGWIEQQSTGDWATLDRKWNADINWFEFSVASTFSTKTAAVRHLIEISGNEYWGYYGESWERHCERTQWVAS